MSEKKIQIFPYGPSVISFSTTSIVSTPSTASRLGFALVANICPGTRNVRMGRMPFAIG